jgi:hypothetical protein
VRPVEFRRFGVARVLVLAATTLQQRGGGLMLLRPAAER